MYRKSRPGKIEFLGFQIVRLPDRCIRTATKFYRNGYAMAVLQKNGNVAVTDTGIFEHKSSPGAQSKTARLLHGLGLINDAWLASQVDRAKDYEHKRDVEMLRDQADELGYELSPKTVQVRTKRKKAT